MKKLLVIATSLALMTACTPVFDNREEVIQETTDENSNQSAIIPNYQMNEENYRMILTENSAKVSDARTVTTYQMGNRLDIAVFENGLRRHSKEYFDPDNYYFQPGQYLSEELLFNWLDRKSERNPSGLNPELNEETATVEQFEQSPRYISNIVEQNYLVKKEDNVVELAGITIGISLRTVYNFTVAGRDYDVNHSTEELLAKGKEYAQQILERMRNSEDNGAFDQPVPDVPIAFALYEQEVASSKVPGNFIAKAYAEGNSLGDWTMINEDHILFPSDEATENYFDDAQLFSDFRTEVAQYFPNFVGMIANGFYKNDELEQVTINIPIQFYSQSEVVGFTQYIYNLVVEMFPDHYGVEVNIYSMDQQESLIVKEPGEDKPFVHIYN